MYTNNTTTKSRNPYNYMSQSMVATATKAFKQIQDDKVEKLIIDNRSPRGEGTQITDLYWTVIDAANQKLHEIVDYDYSTKLDDGEEIRDGILGYTNGENWVAYPNSALLLKLMRR